MTQGILIRNVRPDTVNALKRRARKHHRSLQGELHAIIENAAREVSPEDPRPIRLHTVNTRGRAKWRRDEIYDDSGR